MLCTITSSTNAEWKEFLLFSFVSGKEKEKENSRWESNCVSWLLAYRLAGGDLGWGSATCTLGLLPVFSPLLSSSQRFMNHIDPFHRKAS